jgi:hypothetical protein
VRRRHPPALALAVLVISAASCGSDSDPAGDAQRFCGEVQAHKEALTQPELASSDDILPLIELYRMVGEFAPLAIEAEWDQLIANYETASTVIPGDEDSEQRMVESALRTEKSAVAVSRWLIDNCAVDLGPVATIVAQP